MSGAARVTWRSPAPTGVEEVLTVADDGGVRLLVCTPRSLTGPVGTYTTTATDADLATLRAAGEVTIDMLNQSPSPVRDVAERLATAAREHPLATVTFHAGPVNPISRGVLPMSVFAVAAGDDPTDFLLRALDCTVTFTGAAGYLGGTQMPQPAVDLVTVDAVAVGGIRRRASLSPVDYAASAFDVKAPQGTTSVSIEVVGWLYPGGPGDAEAVNFRVHTEAAPVPA